MDKNYKNYGASKYVILTLMALLLKVTFTFAQLTNYNAWQGTGATYQSIAGTGTNFSWNGASTSTDDNVSNIVPIGFNFTYNGVTFWSFRACTNGWISFDTVNTSTSFTNSELGNAGVAAVKLLTLAPFYDDLVTAGNPFTLASLNTSMFFQVLGTAPNRVLVVEWVGFERFSAPSPDVNFQVRLYEATNHFEYAYGNMNPGSSTFDYTCGFNFTPVPANPTTAVFRAQSPANSTTFTNFFGDLIGNAGGGMPTNFSKLFFQIAAPSSAGPVTASLIPFNAGPSNIIFNWTHAIKGNTINYRIERSSSASGPWANQAFTGSSVDSSFNFTGLLPNTTYFFRVTPIIAGVPDLANAYITSSISTTGCNFLAGGTFSVGPTGTFSSIRAAFDTIGNRGINSNIILELQASYNSASESFPITINDYRAGVCPGPNASVTIRPELGATNLVISGNNGTALFVVDGADYLTIDGRPGGLGTARELTLTNLATSGPVILLRNDVTRNTIQWCNIRSSSTSAVAGAIHIAATTFFNGNDSITISNNYFSRAALTPFASAITSVGASGIFQNNNNTITNNEINGPTAFGISIVGSGNGSFWNISNNSIYDTTTTATTTATVGINFNPSTSSNSNGNLITGNFIGGNAAGAPTGAGQHWNRTSAFAFTGIVSSGGSGSGVQITNNTIRSIRINNGTSFVSFTGINPVNPGVAVVTGNTIGHVTDTNSILTNLSGALIGINASTPNDLTISNNTLYNLNAAGNNTSCAVRGIVVTTASNNVLNIANNTIRALHTRSTATGSTTNCAWNGIAVSSSSPNQTITNNIIGGSNPTDSCSVYYGPVPAFGLAAGAAGGAKMAGIAVAAGTNTVTNNSIRNLISQSNAANTTNTLANINGILVSAFNSGNLIQNNVLDSFVLRTNAIGHMIVGITLSSGGANTNNNTIGNLIAPSTSTLTSANCAISGVNSSSTNPQTITNNTIFNFDCRGNAGTQINGIVFSTGSGHTIQGNTIRNLRSFTTSATGIVGINNQSFGLNNFISNNTIHSLVSYNAGTSAPGMFGIIYGGSATIVGNTNNLITRNNIHSFGADITGTGSLTMTGIQITNGNSLVSNNMIRIGRDTAGAVITRLGNFRGIHLNTSGAIQNRFLHNTIYVETQPALAGIGTSAVIDLAGTATGAGFNDIRNNILVNKSNNVLGTGNQYVIRSGAANLLQHTINSNIFDMNVSATNFAGRFNAVDYASLTNWKTGALMDGASGAGTVGFVNATGDFAAVDLRLSGANIAETGGDASVAAIVTTDFDGAARSGLTPTDIGAFASSNGISSDINPPIITYTNLLNTSSGLDRTFTATISDGGGLPQDVAKQPVVRFKKYIGGTWNSATGVLTSGTRFNGTWSFTMSSSAMGGILSGDSVFYYVLAQDSLGNNTNSNAMYAVATSVTTVTTDPANPAYYKITDPLPTSINVGTGNTYTTLTGTDGLFNAINTGIVQGNTEVLITSDIVETGAVALNRWLEVGAGGYTITVRPDGSTQRIISTTAANTNGMIRLNDVNGFRMLGWSPSGTNADTNLIVRSSSTSTPALSILNGGSNDTLVGVIFESRVNNTFSGTIFIQTTALPATRGMSNMLIQNCHFRQDYTSFGASFPANGVFAQGIAPRLNSDIRITGCQFYNNSAQGINVQGGAGNNWNISNNHFYFTALPTQTTSYQAISFQAGQFSDNNTITGNWIGGRAPFVGGTPLVISNTFFGINSNSGIVSGTAINNNVISNINVTSASTLNGIQVIGTSAIYTVNGNRIGDFNNIASSIIFTSTSNNRLTGINSSATGNVTITNDTIVNILNQGTTAAGITGINVQSGSSNTTVISNNLVRNLVLTACTNTGTATIASLQGITCQSSSLAQTISNNTIQSLVNSNIGGHQTVGIMNTGGATNISNNIVRGIYSRTSSTNLASPINFNTSTVMGIIGISNPSTATGTQLVVGNTLDSIAHDNVSASQVFGISLSSSFAPATISIIQNNVVRNMYSRSTLAAGSVYTTSTVTLALVGIFNCTISPNNDISGNVVSNLNHLSNSASAVLGIANSNSASFNGNVSTVNRNFVHSIVSKAFSPNVPILVGIWNNAGIATYSNNMVRMGIDSSATLDTAARITRGIYQDPLNTNANRYYHNSILIAGTPSSGAANSAAIEIGIAIPAVNGVVNVVDIRNNILANRVNGVFPAVGRNYGLRLVNTTNIVSNYNIFNITGDSGFVAATNVNNFKLLGGATTSWATTGLDVTSASIDPNFSTNAMGTADVATLALQGTTPAERSGDATISSVTTDYFGTTRATNTPTDVGAHAGNFNLSPDAFPPVISFTPLVNTGTLSGTRAFNNVTITDNNGIPTSGTTRPRVYYSKDGITWFSVASTTITGTATNAVASFNIDYAPLAPLTVADTVRYYVIAQDNAGNIISNSPYAVATDVNTVTTHPAVPNRFTFLPIIAANSVFQIGSGSTYTSLTGTGGFFEFINSRTLGGSVFGEITSDLLNEPGTVSLNQFAEDGAGAGTYSLTIRPVAGTTSPFLIQGSVSNTLINLNSSSRVKITGVPTTGASTVRYLRFRNDNTGASVISIRNGAQGVRLNNLILEGGNTSGTSGIVALEVLAGTVPCSFDSITGCLFNNNSTIAAPNGLALFQLYSNGAIGVLNANNFVNNNEFANGLVSGIVLNNNNGPNWTITNNSFYYNLPFTPTTANLFPVQLVPGINGTNYTITGNFVGGSAALCGGTPWSTNANNANFSGMVINLGPGTSSVISNNTVNNISFTNSGTPIFNGINITAGNVTVTNNTIGSTSVNNSIVFAHASTHNGIQYSGSNIAVINNNTIAGINVGVLGQFGSFNAINVTNGAVTAINGNTIGSALANSIVNNGTGVTTGISCSQPASLTPTFTVNNNTIRNMHMPGTQSSLTVRGIFTSFPTAAPTISGNTINNLTSNSSNLANTGTNMAIIGIALATSGSTVATVTNNTVSALRALNTAGTATPNVTGISLSGGQNTIINANRIFDLTNASTSTSVLPTPSVAGISISSGSVNAFVSNNQITLGSGATQNTQFNGIWLLFNTTSFTLNAINNSVLITGASAGGNQNSYAFLRGNNTATEISTFLNLQNNILANNRTGGTGTHYALANQTPAPTNNTWVSTSSQYNLLVTSSANAVGQWGTNPQNYANWIANATSDARSYYIPSGTGAGQLNLSNLFTSTSNGDLGLQSANTEAWYAFGKAAAGVTVNNLATDYAGTARGTTFGFGNTIGSIQLASAPSIAPPAAIASATPAANTSVNYTFASRAVATINWGASAPTAATMLNFTGVTAQNQPSGNNANQYVRTDISGGTAPYNYSVVYNYDPALLGSISSANAMQVSTQTTGSTLASPVWLTQPIATVNSSASTVTTGALTNSLANMFFTVTENNAPPLVSRFVPTSGPVGASISIYGRNFTGTTALSFFNGIAQATFTVVNDTTITTTIPVGATTGVVSATNPNGTGTSTAQVTVIQAPTISSFSPVAGTFATVVNIIGTNFSTATQVQFNGINAAAFTIVSATSINATVPSNASASGTISVINPAGTGTSTGTFTVYPAPSITSFTPGSGAVGASVTITGTDFNAISNVRFNGVDASYTVNSATSIVAIVPAGASTGAITAVNGSGTGTSGTNFTVLQLPTITTFTPSSGGIGTSVVISGTNFTGATAVTFNGTAAASYVVNSATQITAVVATGTTTGLVAVTTPSGTVSSTGNNFTVISDLVVSTNTNVSGTYNNITVTATGVANLNGTLTALGNVLVQTGGIMNFGTEVLSGNGNFTTQTSSRLRVGSPVGISATGGISGNIQVAGTRTFASAASIEYNGSVAQVAGEGLTNVDTLVINNANGVSLNLAATVNTSLTLTAGNLLLANNNLTLGTNSTITGASAAAFVVTNGTGSLRRTVQNNATNVTYPVGSNTTAYTPANIQLSNASTTDVLAVRVFNGVFVTGNNTGAQINNNVVNRTWLISEAVAGGSSATIEMAWDDSLELSGFARTNCAIARNTGTGYGNIGLTPYAAAGLSGGQRTRSLAGITTFGHFAIGDNISGLPVQLVSLQANVADNDNDVIVSWITASELNNKGFNVERSIDGKTFEYVDFVKGAGNSNNKLKYNFVDERAFEQANANVIYYRLKQLDFDGKFEYSPIVKVNRNAEEISTLSVYPNPFSDNFSITFTAKNASNATVEITDIQGKVVNVITTGTIAGLNTIEVSDTTQLKAGIYFVRLTLNGETQVMKLVRR